MTITRASSHSWFNGTIGDREIGAPSVASINFHLGTSVFDGLMAYWNDDHYYIHMGEEHLQRFRRGSARMGLNFQWSVEDLLFGLDSLLKVEPKGTQYVRPIAYRRAPELWVTGNKDRPVDVSIFTVRAERDQDFQISCHVSPVERISSRSIPGQIKVSGAYVNSFHARHVAEEAGFQDGIMLDRRGFVSEASAANFFAIRRQQLITPKLSDDTFPGITRKVVIDIARDLGLDCGEIEMNAENLLKVDGAFLCSTLMEIRGINKIGSRALSTVESPVFAAIITAFRRITHQ
jgi:branched-chain amino acid aminotransferase